MPGSARRHSRASRRIASENSRTRPRWWLRSAPPRAWKCSTITPVPMSRRAGKTTPAKSPDRSSASTGTAPNVHEACPRRLGPNMRSSRRAAGPDRAASRRSIASSRRPLSSTVPSRSVTSKRMSRWAGSTRESRAGDHASRGADTPRDRSRKRASDSFSEPSPHRAPATNSLPRPARGITARRTLLGRARRSASTFSSSIPGTSHSNRPGSRSTSTSSGIVTVSPSSSSPGANR